MTAYYLTVRPDGAPFTAAPLFAHTTPTDVPRTEWPCRVLRVEPTDGAPVTIPDLESLPNGRAAAAWRTVEELPAHLALGPQGEHVAALIARAATLTADDGATMARLRGDADRSAWRDAWRAARVTAREPATVAAYTATFNAMAAAATPGRDAAAEASLALMVRDVLPASTYDTLTAPWRQAVGTLHPGDLEPTP